MAADAGQVEEAIAALEAARATLGDGVVDATIESLRRQLAGTDARPEERRHLTVLFAELDATDGGGERRDPEEVRDRFGPAWARIDAALHAHGAHIDKHVGRSVMALFGIPHAREDDAERALAAALAIREIVASLGGPELDARVGIHSGLVILTPVGQAGEWTAIGDTVNIASRLQHAAAPGEALVSNTAWRQARGRYRGSRLSPLSVKGRSDPVDLWRLESQAAGSDTPVGLDSQQETQDLEAREELLTELDRELASVATSGRPRIVSLVGEAGLGKTTVGRTFLERVMREGRVAAVRVATTAGEHRGLPYGVLRDWLFRRLDLRDDAPGALASSRLFEGVRMLPGASIRQAATVTRLLGMEVPDAATQLDLAESREEAFAAVHRLLAGTLDAVGGPMVVVLDGIDAADDDSLDLIESVMGLLGPQPLFALLLSRPSLLERRPRWAGEIDFHSVVRLAPLPAEALGRIARRLLESAGHEDAAELGDRLARAAGGNPMFLEELVREALEGGAGRLTEVPSSLAALLQARVDRLPPDDRLTAQLAATAGHRFTDRALRTAAPELTEEIDGRIQRLVDREVVEPSEPPRFEGARDYRFRSAVLHAVVRESALKRDARVWHRRLAEWLDGLGGTVTEARLAQIAEHWVGAGELARAADTYEAASRLSWTHFAPRASMAHDSRVLEILPEDGEHAEKRLGALSRLGRSHGYSGEPVEATAAMTRLCQEARACGDHLWEARGWYGRSLAASDLGRLSESLALARRARTITEGLEPASGVPPERDPALLLLQALIMESSALVDLGNLEDARLYAERALSLAEPATDAYRTYGVAAALRHIASCDGLSGRFEDAERALRRATMEARRIDSPPAQALVALGFGDVAVLRGDLETAREHFEAARALARNCGDRTNAWTAEVELAALAVSLERWEDATERLDTLAEEVPPEWVAVPLVSALLASARWHRGETDGARAAAREAFDHLRGEAPVGLVSRSWRLLGKWCSASGESLGDLGEVVDELRCLQRALEALSLTDLVPERAHTLVDAAAAERRAGNLDRAAAQRAEAEALAVSLGIRLSARPA